MAKAVKRCAKQFGSLRFGRKTPGIRAFGLTNPSVYPHFAWSVRPDLRELGLPHGSVSSGVARPESAPVGLWIPGR